jgi:ATP-binding cassette, subfamily B, bacterial
VRDWLRSYRLLMAIGFRAAPVAAVIFLVCGVLMSLGAPAASFGAKLLVDGAVSGSASQELAAVVVLSVAAPLALVSTIFYTDFLFNVAEDASDVLDRRLMRLAGGIPTITHHEHPEFNDRLDFIRESRWRLPLMINATVGLLRTLVQLVVSIVLLARIQPLLLPMPLFAVVSFVIGRAAAKLQVDATEATVEAERLRRHLFNQATSASAGKEVRVFGLAGELLARHRAAAEAVLRARNRADVQAAGLRALDGAVSAGVFAGAVGLVLALAIAGRATPGDVVLTLALAAGLNFTIDVAVSYGTQFLTVLHVARRMLWLEDYAEQAAAGPPDPAPVPARLGRGIDLDGVSFSYPFTAGRETLSDVTLHLPAGTVVALVGENGAGKTTLVKLLCGFYQPVEGQITVDGVDLRCFDVAAWRSGMSAAFQDFCSFELLVRETVGVGDIARLGDPDAVWSALGGADAADMVRRLPQGLGTQLGSSWEGGVDLSRGQWQRLALARARMRAEPLLVVFDEPTAALDPQTEHALFERITNAARRAERSGAVVLLVSHRFSTVRMADLIVVLEKGRIVERGSHERLMLTAGVYAELYELQSRAYR